MSDKTVKDVLIEARKLLENPEHWTKRAPARNEAGEQVHFSSDRACQWCADGALFRVAPDRWIAGSAEDAFARGIRALGSRAVTVWTFNDHPKTDHTRVLAAFDKAIEKCGS